MDQVGPHRTVSDRDVFPERKTGKGLDAHQGRDAGRGSDALRDRDVSQGLDAHQGRYAIRGWDGLPGRDANRGWDAPSRDAGKTPRRSTTDWKSIVPPAPGATRPAPGMKESEMYFAIFFGVLVWMGLICLACLQLSGWLLLR
jgi:hypothetical protein